MSNIPEALKEEGRDVTLHQEVEFDKFEDEIDFIDVEQEIDNRRKTRQKITKQIDKIIEKSAIYADETGNKFVNTLKRFNDNMHDITEDELKSALRDTLKESDRFSDDEITEFLMKLDIRKEKEPHFKLFKRLEKLIDDYDEGDIDIKDIKEDNRN